MENPVEQINNIANMDDFLNFVVQLAMDSYHFRGATTWRVSRGKSPFTMCSCFWRHTGNCTGKSQNPQYAIAKGRLAYGYDS